ncbi:hypothetical protein AXF42_Ash008934 [Apostasia shenzhenica]|uniref:Secreted protein n=1 Tax=Apostasia shenzhenica TaxID=1088818 RepID=A0A2I0ASZ7_9ASPA|nr:hypothetical protein AXF42_Ash008934 [Apostasia shenzhenica]
MHCQSICFVAVLQTVFLCVQNLRHFYHFVDIVDDTKINLVRQGQKNVCLALQMKKLRLTR